MLCACAACPQSQQYNVSSASDYPVSRLKDAPTAVIDFCFANLHHSKSSAVQHAAATCLGVLSRFFLAPICNILVEKSKSLKNVSVLRSPPARFSSLAHIPVVSLRLRRRSRSASLPATRNASTTSRSASPTVRRSQLSILPVDPS